MPTNPPSVPEVLPRATRADALAFFVHAMQGSLAGNPTEDYLKELRRCLYALLEQVETRLAEVVKATEDNDNQF